MPKIKQDYKHKELDGDFRIELAGLIESLKERGYKPPARADVANVDKNRITFLWQDGIHDKV